jgi:hypothetical protein
LLGFYSKEKIMVSKRFLLGMLVMALALGMTVIGCGDGSSSDSDKTPVVGDYDISNNLAQTVGSVTAVTVTAKAGKSPGAVTVKYAGSTTLPENAGTYAVTFDVAAATGWKAKTGLSAGDLIISTGSSGGTIDKSDYKTVYYQFSKLPATGTPGKLHIHAESGTVEILTIFLSSSTSGADAVYIFDGKATPQFSLAEGAEDANNGEWVGGVLTGAVSDDHIVLHGDSGTYRYNGGFGTAYFATKAYLGFVVKDTTATVMGDIRFGFTPKSSSSYILNDIRFDMATWQDASKMMVTGTGGLGVSE